MVWYASVCVSNYVRVQSRHEMKSFKVVNESISVSRVCLKFRINQVFLTMVYPFQFA